MGVLQLQEQGKPQSEIDAAEARAGPPVITEEARRSLACPSDFYIRAVLMADYDYKSSHMFQVREQTTGGCVAIADHHMKALRGQRIGGVKLINARLTVFYETGVPALAISTYSTSFGELSCRLAGQALQELRRKQNQGEFARLLLDNPNSDGSGARAMLGVGQRRMLHFAGVVTVVRVDSDAGVCRAIEALTTAGEAGGAVRFDGKVVMGLDCEWEVPWLLRGGAKRRGEKEGKVATLQICAGRDLVVVFRLVIAGNRGGSRDLRAAGPLKDFLMSTGVVFVGRGIVKSDVRKLKDDHKLEVRHAQELLTEDSRRQLGIPDGT